MAAKEKICVHCLHAAGTTRDHIFPDSWYPDSTPSTVQHWTVPSCLICNAKFGELEKELLVRLVGCIDPSETAATGLHEKALRSMGIGVTEELSETEWAKRKTRRAQIASEFIPFNGSDACIPGLGPPHQEAKSAIRLPLASFSIMAEKVVRGCEFKFHQRLVQPPYAVVTMLWSERTIPEEAIHLCRQFNFGPGLKINRAAHNERVHYWMLFGILLG